MIEEIFPVLTGNKRFKMLSPKGSVFNNLPSVRSHISFLPFVNFLKNKLDSVSTTQADFYKYLIKKFEEKPALLQHIDDIQILNDNEELLALISTAIFPIVCNNEENNFTFSAPYQFDVFSYSEPFKKLFIDEEEEYLQLPENISEEQLKHMKCALIYEHILEKYYSIKLNDSPELVYSLNDSINGMKRYFRIRYDRRFIDVHIKGDLPPIIECGVCLNTFRILDLEKQLRTMPLELFEAEGFAIWIAEDVTIFESLEWIKKILLRQDEYGNESIKELKIAIQALVGLNEVEVGLMPFVKINDCFLLNEEYTRHSLMGKHWKSNDEESNSIFTKIINFIEEHPEPMPVSNVDEGVAMISHMKVLYEDGTRSYIYYPIQNSDGLLGILEMSSPIPNLLNHEIMARLEPAIPLLSVAMIKERDTFNNKVEKLVKEKFTALQPSVEWKFSEVAWEYLKSNGSVTETKKIIFDNVYPLYGAIDVRNSSNERSQAIQKDLKEHLHLIDDTLDKLQSIVQLTLLEGLKFKNRNFQEAIENVLIPEDEVRINEFLENELEPVFCHLQKSNDPAQSIIENYFNLFKDHTSHLFHCRNKYEETLTTINHTVINYLREQEEILQKSYPHYFEKYRTDGAEYNIYIGQSMAPSHPFDLLYLKNIRIWQLQSMAEIGRITHKLLPSLKVPLETTQLILIHNQPISISFRKDERRFDVEGSHNIRYEIMKKRIDKARIKDTQERLTQPGKISMVYCNQKEAQEYEEYIRFLQSKDLLQPGIENVDLEELQGLRGLRAFRVNINLE